MLLAVRYIGELQELTLKRVFMYVVHNLKHCFFFLCVKQRNHLFSRIANINVNLFCGGKLFFPIGENSIDIYRSVPLREK